MASLLHRLTEETLSSILAMEAPASLTASEEAEAMAEMMAEEAMAEDERSARCILAGW